MGTLVLLRHGQSVWNAENLFTGWVDVPLSEKGEQEARRGGELLRGRGPAARRRAHLAAAPRHLHRQPRAGRLRPALDPGAPRLAAQRAPLRRAAGQGQEADPRRPTARSSSCSGAAPTTCRRRRSSPGSEFSQDGDPRYAGLGDDHARAPSASPTSSRGSCPTGSPRSCPTCATARSCCSPRTATRCARWSSTSTAISDADIAGLNIPTGIPLRYELDDDAAPHRAGRHVPRPGGRRKRPPPRWPHRDADAAGFPRRESP